MITRGHSVKACVTKFGRELEGWIRDDGADRNRRRAFHQGVDVTLAVRTSVVEEVRRVNSVTGFEQDPDDGARTACRLPDRVR
jgi:hypothetical protein